MGANQILTWNFEDKRPEDEHVFSAHVDPLDTYGVARVAFLTHVVDAVIDETASPADGVDGRNAVALVSAIYDSIDTGKEILLAPATPKRVKANA